MARKKAKSIANPASGIKHPAKAANAANKPFFQPFADLERAAKANAKDAATAKAKEPAAAKSKEPPPRRAPEPRSPEPRRSADPSPISDAETFSMYMAGVQALGGGATRIPATASAVHRSAPVVPTSDPDAPARASLRSLVAEGVRFEVSDDGRTLEGRRVDLDPRELRRLRRHEHAVDARLDLHGMTADEARTALEAFVHKRRLDGDRVIVVVHGKGKHSPRGISVLRGEIGAWMSQGRASRDVAAFTSIVDGDASSAFEGSGALLVLLAR